MNHEVSRQGRDDPACTEATRRVVRSLLSVAGCAACVGLWSLVYLLLKAVAP